MKKLFTIFLLLAITNFLNAQSQNMLDKIEAAKIGVITQKLNLSPEQAKTFWATYTQYSEDKKKIRKELMQLSDATSTANDDQVSKNMDRMMDLKEQEVALDRKYYKEFQKSISIRQIFELYKAEIMFRKMLMDKLVKRAERKGKKLEDMGDDLD
jgi:Skp family chaperone for outer membrane proteins